VGRVGWRDRVGRGASGGPGQAGPWRAALPQIAVIDPRHDPICTAVVIIGDYRQAEKYLVLEECVSAMPSGIPPSAQCRPTALESLKRRGLY
jgi:hypothetical protein